MSATATIDKPLALTVDKASEALGISESTLRRLPIPFIRTGPGHSARRLYAVSDLEASIAANRRTT